MNNDPKYLERQHHLRERIYSSLNQIVREEDVTPDELVDAVRNCAQGIALAQKVAIAKVAEEANAN